MSKNKEERLKAFIRGEIPDESTSPTQEIALDLIHPNPLQPRRYFDEESLESLAESIAQQGVIQPILIRPRKEGDGYEIVAGERRYQASKKIGKITIPATIQELSDEQVKLYSLVENLQREELNPVDETEGILDLLALKLNCDREGVISLLNAISKEDRKLADNVVRPSQRRIIAEVFQQVGMTREAFRTHRLPLLNMAEPLLQAIREGKLSYTKVREIAKVKDVEKRDELLERAIAEKLSIREIKKAIANLKPKKDSLEELIDSTFSKLKKAEIRSDMERRERIVALMREIDRLLSDS